MTLVSPEAQPSSYDGEASAGPIRSAGAGGLARSASILAVGSMVGRVLGLARETIIADLFGASGAVSAFRLASRVPFMIYDLLVGGMLSAALVPVLSDYARPERRRELWPVVSALFSLLGAVLAVLVLLLELLAPQVAWLLGGGFDAPLQAVLVRSLRILSPAVLCMGLAGAATAALYALERFTLPAFGAAVFNLGIIVGVGALARPLHVDSIAVGVLLGSLGQLAIQLPGLRDARLRVNWAWNHPALRRIGQLYLPIALGMVVSQIQVIIDGNLASRTGPQSVAWMQNATTLIQFPHGLIAVAISLASLPSLSQLAAGADWGAYRRTLAQALRLVLYLILPATVGLWVMARPIVRLIFEHGAFTATDTVAVVAALRLYLVGLVFAAVDWPLNYAFYAQQDTRTPAAIGVAAVVVYLVVALALLQPLSYLGLVLADSAKHAAHAVTMAILLRRRVGGLGSQEVIGSASYAAGAALAMGGITGLAIAWLEPALPIGTLLGNLTSVVAGGLLALASYGAITFFLRMEESRRLWMAVTSRLQRGRSGASS
jgi:putative peptidoglycan lipid II flippase